jgi:hypothetical protein
MFTKNLRLKTIVVVLMTILLAAAVDGCCDTRGGTRLKWEKIADGDGAGEEFWDKFTNHAYEGDVPRLIVVTDPAAVPTLQGHVSPSHLELVTGVDFSSYWVAVIHRGKEIVKDYKPIEVGSVRLRDGIVTIQSRLRRGTWEPADSLMTVSPYYILKIRKPADVEEKEIAFTLEDDGQVTSKICAVEGERLPWEKVVFDRGGYGGASYGGRSPRLVVIARQTDVPSVQNQLLSEHLSLIADVDFSTHFVAIIYQGEKGSTDYSVEVIDVKQAGDKIVLCAQLHEPIPHQVRGQMVTSPYYVVKIERPEGSGDAFTFVLLDGDEEIVRQTETIP